MKQLKSILFTLTIALLIFSCKKKNDDNTTTPIPDACSSVKTIGSETTLGGYIKGVLKANTTYTVTDDVYVCHNDSLTIQSGAVIKVNGSHAFYISGTFQSLGTQIAPVKFTTADPSPNVSKGYWGGIQCDSNAKTVKLLWTKVLWTGGANAAGDAQFSLSVQGTSSNNSSTSVIIQDCWFYAGGDDGLRLTGPISISLMRNTFQHMGSSDGETINIKSGVTGDVAYNYIWSAANNGIKLETSSTIKIPQTNVNVYNNTIVSGGFRKVDEPTSGILVDRFARGSVYNNILVNNHQGLRITNASDYAYVKSHYGNNLFYATADTLKAFFYPSTDTAKTVSSDIFQDPKFIHLVDLGTDIGNAKDQNDAHLQSGSPAIGKGNTTLTPTNAASVHPNMDLGAYPSDGTGNKHTINDLNSDI